MAHPFVAVSKEHGYESYLLAVPVDMLQRLIEYIECAGYCPFCDRRPGDKHYRHDPKCPLWIRTPPEEK